MTNSQTQFCSDDQLMKIVRLIERDDQAGMAEIEMALQQHPDDPMLHFLCGSLQAGQQHYQDAIASIARAVEITPDYRIARFQLGFLQFTSGNNVAAQQAWQLLEPYALTDCLSYFARGLQHLAVDEFDAALHHLRRGMAINEGFPLLNGDMQRIIDEVGQLPRQEPPQDSPTDSAHVLLQQYSAGKFTKH
jgi:tetratricopeptide (TPR) repeat protein